MSKQPETPAERLVRTSEIYRRMQAEVQPPSLSGQASAEAQSEMQPLPTPAAIARPVSPLVADRLPQSPASAEPDFVRRLLTRRPDRRELVLLGVVAIAVLYSIHPF